MFLRLAAEVRNSAIAAGQPNFTWAQAADEVFRYRPVDLLDYLERFWSTDRGAGRDYVATPVLAEEASRRALGEPARVGNPPNAANVRPAVPGVTRPVPAPDAQQGQQGAWQHRPVWPHLIYAFAVENTRIFEVFRRVLRELQTGERLGRPSPDIISWARNTEELCFTDRLGHWFFSPVSRLRDDGGAIRRNAYYRLFGMDLNHGTEDGRPYAYLKPDTANRDFVPTFERLLRETWAGYVNRNNQYGENTTDVEALGDLVLRLHDMLRDRRLHGLLAREEFYAVALLSWFHLTVNSNNSVITMLQAEGNNPAQRLSAVGERVTLPAHARSYDYFMMCQDLSEILGRIECGSLTAANASTLYDMSDGTTSQMLRIISHWSAASGRNLKDLIHVPASGGRRQLVPGAAPA